MKYAGILENDFVNGQGVCVSFWAQGCPFHCKGCHNPQTWSFSEGKDASEEDLISQVINAIDKNGIQRNLSILGGEPLCPENINFVVKLINNVKIKFPNIKVYIWSGYTFDELKDRNKTEDSVKQIFKQADYLMTGRFILEQRDISLRLIGSRNQQILQKGKDY